MKEAFVFTAGFTFAICSYSQQNPAPTEEQKVIKVLDQKCVTPIILKCLGFSPDLTPNPTTCAEGVGCFSKGPPTLPSIGQNLSIHQVNDKIHVCERLTSYSAVVPGSDASKCWRDAPTAYTMQEGISSSNAALKKALDQLK